MRICPIQPFLLLYSFGVTIFIINMYKHYNFFHEPKSVLFSDYSPIPNGKKQACVHPDLNLNEDVIAYFFYKSEPIECDSEPDWICIKNGFANVCSKTLENHEQVECNFTFLHRKSDYLVIKSRNVRLRDFEVVRLKSDFFRVVCKDKIGEQWKNIMAGIHKKSDVFQRAGREYLPNDSLGLNVLIWGYDSLSRMTFMRKLPKTYKYLTEKLGAVVLKGYNIIGDGTPKALIPILTGKTESELPETRRRMKPKANYVDVYPFIWKDFQKNGYVTAFGEDCPEIGTFTYRLMGFNEQPTDHYMTTFYMAAESQFKDHRKFCLRATPRHKVAMNWIRHFYSTYDEKPKFSFSYLSEISHDDHNLIGAVDEDLHQMIYSFQADGYLNNTLLIIMSDHGYRFAKIRETRQGKQEERLPFFAFVFPPWFEQKYPIAMMNFRRNSERLTAPFDIYPTLYNILHFQGPGKGNVKERGISLFKEVPLSRTCADAGIEPHWCACLNWETVLATNSLVQMAAQTLVEYINNFTESKREFCAPLKLDKVVFSGKYLPNKEIRQGLTIDMSDYLGLNLELYQIKIHTQPGEGHFEASLKYNVKKKSFKVNESEISRVNKYENDAKCIQNTEEHLRKYCYCTKSKI